MFRIIPCTVACIAALALSACATTNGTSSSEMPADTANAPMSSEVHWVSVTGSRIRQRVGSGEGDLPMTSYPLAIYGQDELQSTGHQDLEQALRLLDPSVR